MVTIAKCFDFDAAHWLPNVPDGHKCKRMHGHTYRVRLSFVGTPDERGFVLDYAEIDALWQPVHDLVDHHTLNDIVPNPTTENMLHWMVPLLKHPKLTRIRLYESSATFAEVEVYRDGQSLVYFPRPAESSREA